MNKIEQQVLEILEDSYNPRSILEKLKPFLRISLEDELPKSFVPNIHAIGIYEAIKTSLIECKATNREAIEIAEIGIMAINDEWEFTNFYQRTMTENKT